MGELLHQVDNIPASRWTYITFQCQLIRPKGAMAFGWKLCQILLSDVIVSIKIRFTGKESDFLCYITEGRIQMLFVSMTDDSV